MSRSEGWGEREASAKLGGKILKDPLGGREVQYSREGEEGSSWGPAICRRFSKAPKMRGHGHSALLCAPSHVPKIYIALPSHGLSYSLGNALRSEGLLPLPFLYSLHFLLLLLMNDDPHMISVTHPLPSSRPFLLHQSSWSCVPSFLLCSTLSGWMTCNASFSEQMLAELTDN